MGDRSIIAWGIVLGYVAAALLAFAAAKRGRKAAERWFWILAAAVLLLLGLNKQLDVQTFIVDLARELARAGGWYEHRRIVQGAFIGGLVAGAAAGALVLATRLRRAPMTIKIAGAGLVLLALFVIIRAASLHPVDLWVTADVAGLRTGWWIEIAGIAVVALGAARYRARRR